jgi:PAS domain S-box-containing protein
VTDKSKTDSHLTVHVQARQVLKKIDIHGQEAWDGSPEMFASVEADSARILQCNQTLADVLGYRQEALVGRLIFELYHPRCRPKAIQTFRTFLETGEIHNAELQLQCEQGKPVDVLLNVSAVRDKHGKILYSRSVWRIFTESKTEVGASWR